MTTANYLDLAMRAAAIGLVCFAITGQVIKPGLRMLAKKSRAGEKLTRAQEEFYRWITRLICLTLGFLLGMLPLWPSWMIQAWWGPLLGLCGGSFAPALHHALNKAIPSAAARLISGKGIRS